MAATGLLGFNPYGKGVAIDFSSKPTQLAIQLGQREQAKKEALDKYFMDYEKSINPAGMRKAESDIFLRKLADNKAFYIQNRDKILNPAKYGYDAQSQYMSNFKDMTNIIDQSKQAAANDKLTTQHFIAQKNLNAPDGYVEAVEASHLPITDPRYRPLDVTQFKFWKSHDPFEFGKELKTLNTIPGKPELMKEGNYQYQRTPMEADINNLKSFSYNKLGDVGYVKMLQNLSDEEVGQLRKVYKQRLNAELPKNDAKELSLAYTLTNLPKDYTQTNMVEQPSYTRAQQDALIRGRQNKGSGSDVAKFLEGGVTALNTNNASFINDYFKPWKAQTKTGTGGDVIGFQNIELLPDGTVKVNYSTPMTKSKKGTSFVFANPQSRIFNPKSSSLLQELTSLHQELLGSSVKAEDVAYTDTNPTPPPSTDGNKATKGKSPIIWKK
jgi:hypothetical protein